MPVYYIVDAQGNTQAIGSGSADLSNLNASNLTSGTVPLARLSGITNGQIDAAAAIAYSKLALTGSIVDADVSNAAAIAWSKLSKSGSSLADLATRSAGDLTSGTLPVARLGNGVTTVVTTTSTGSQNDFAPGFVGNTLVRCNNATDLTITGLAGGVDGQTVTFVSIGAGKVLFAHQNTSSSAGNRLINTATSANTPLAAGAGCATYQYDATTARWRLIEHIQGALITPTFSAGDFTGNGAMTWSVDAGDVQAMGYYLRGNMMHLEVRIVTSTVGGTPNTNLLIGKNQWGGFSVSSYDGRIPVDVSDNGTSHIGVAVAGTVLSSSVITVFADQLTHANWTASTNNTNVIFTIEFSVL